MPEIYQSSATMEHDEHNSSSLNSGNLNSPPSPFVFGVAYVPASGIKLISSSSYSSSLSSSSSSSDSPEDIPFGGDDDDGDEKEEFVNQNDDNFEMHIPSLAVVDRVDFHVSSKNSRSSSSSSLNDDELAYEEEHRDTHVGNLPMLHSVALDGGVDDDELVYEEKHRDTHVGSLPMLHSVALDGVVDDEGLNEESKPSSPTSSSSGSVFDGHFGFDEELTDKDRKNLIMQSVINSHDGVDLEDTVENARSSVDSSSSVDSPRNGPFVEDHEEHRITDDQILAKLSDVEEELYERSRSSSSSYLPDSPSDRHLEETNEGRDNNIGILMVEFSNTVDGEDLHVSSKHSRSSSASSALPDSPSLNDLHINSMVPSSPHVDGIDVNSPSKASRSSSISSQDFPLYGPFEESNNITTENLAPQSYPDDDGVDLQTLTKLSRSSSSSSSSSDSPFNNGNHESNTVKLTVQSPPSIDCADLHSKTSRCTSASSSPKSPLKSHPYGKGDEEIRGSSAGNSIAQSSPDRVKVDFQAIRKTSRSSSSCSSSPGSPLSDSHKNTNSEKLKVQFSSNIKVIDTDAQNITSIPSKDSPMDDSIKDDNEETRNLMMQSSCVDKGDAVQALRTTSRSSSASSSSPDSPLKDGKDTNTDKLTVQSPSPIIDGVDNEAEGNISKPPKDFLPTDSCKNGDGNTRNLMLQSSTGINQDDIEVPSKTWRSSSTSSSSSDSSHDEPPVKQSPPELDHKGTGQDKQHGDPVSRDAPLKKELPDSVQSAEASNHSSESNLVGNTLTLNSPPTQVMERPTKTSKYRIPSHVFARTKSNSPVDWSMASNESLFSIQMGNMSFTGDQMFMKSQELGMPGELSSMAGGPGHVFNYSANQVPGSKTTNEKIQEKGAAEASVETMKVVNENGNQKNSAAEVQLSHHPVESASSNKSFAFPVLSDSEKGTSVSAGGDGSSKGAQKVSSPKTEPPPTQSSEQEQEQAEKKNPVGAHYGFRLKWISCIPYCTFCH